MKASTARYPNIAPADGEGGDGLASGQSHCDPAPGALIVLDQGGRAFEAETPSPANDRGAPAPGPSSPKVRKTRRRIRVSIRAPFWLKAAAAIAILGGLGHLAFDAARGAARAEALSTMKSLGLDDRLQYGGISVDPFARGINLRDVRVRIGDVVIRARKAQIQRPQKGPDGSLSALDIRLHEAATDLAGFVAPHSDALAGGQTPWAAPEAAALALALNYRVIEGDLAFSWRYSPRDARAYASVNFRGDGSVSAAGSVTLEQLSPNLARQALPALAAAIDGRSHALPAEDLGALEIKRARLTLMDAGLRDRIAALLAYSAPSLSAEPQSLKAQLGSQSQEGDTRALNAWLKTQDHDLERALRAWLEQGRSLDLKLSSERRLRPFLEDAAHASGVKLDPRFRDWASLTRNGFVVFSNTSDAAAKR